MAWTERTVGKNRDYVLAYESLTLPDSAGANVTTIESSTIEHDISNQKFLVTLAVTEVCAGDGDLDIKLQACYDIDATVPIWEDLDAILGLGVDPTGLNSDTAWCDTTLYNAPYYRFQVFSDGTDTQDAAAVKVTYSAKTV